MNLFEIKQNVVVFAPQALVLAPFKEIWDCVTNKDKSMAVKELSFVYYMADDRSDFQYELDMDERALNVKKFVLLDDNWIQSGYIKKAIDFYNEQSETTSTKLLRSTRGIIQKMSHFLDSIDPNERDKSNKLVFTTAQIISSVEKMPKLIKALNDIETEVVREKSLKNANGNRDVGLNDDSGI